MRYPVLLLTAIPLLWAQLAGATCSGSNILDALPDDERNRLEMAAAQQPFHQGNFWRATKDGQEVTLVGTYHLDDPRHDRVMEQITPWIAGAQTLLVEAGPQEEAALKAAVARDPSVFVLPDTTLPQMMPPDEWALLSDAMERRGVPGFMAAKFQPWYVTVMLALPPCMMTNVENAKGLDGRIIAAAEERDIPVKALEPYDTIFTLFADMEQADQISMIRSSLAMEDQAEDYLATLADSYFAEESRLIWELMRKISLELPGSTPDQVEADLEKMEQALIVRRNQSWIAVIEAAAAEGPVLAAFGALHLPGAQGIPALLQDRGWSVTRLPG